jgi:ribosomal protein S6
MKEKEMDIEQETENTSKVYELGYLFVPTIKEEDLSLNYTNLKDTIVSFGAEIISDEMPKSIPLAYSMVKVISNVRNKFNTAYFGWVKFAMPADKVLELKKNLDLDNNIIRFLILKTVKENTIATKKFARSETYKKPSSKKTGENEVVAPINKEEIDKEIDAMVSV